MSTDDLQKHGTALENQFFSNVDARLLTTLREDIHRTESAKSLAEETGLKDDRLLQAMIASGVTVPSIAALRLFPLVAVAWADGMLEDAERESVMAAAAKHAIARDSAAGQLVQSWLNSNPGPELFDAWEAFAKHLVSHLPLADAKVLGQAIVDEVKQVAQSAGGVLGWAAISRGEHRVLNRITEALHRPI